MWSILREILGILNDSAVYLLLGFLLAGFLNVLLSRYQRLTSVLTAPGSRSVYLAAFLGAPLPLCSCSVLPTALMLRRQGATKGTAASFLISVPETDVISIVLTYALLGPIMAVARPVSALVTAIVTGLVVNRIDERGKPTPVEPVGDVPEKGNAATDLEPGTGVKASSDPQTPDKRGWLARALQFGFVEMFDDIIVQIFIGIFIGGAVIVWLPGLGLEGLVGHSPLTYLVMLGIGIPVYVCATASTPLAVGLIAGGVSPGAALVFLLAGPASNIASLLVLNRQFGPRILAAYLACIAVVSVAMGVCLDAVVGPDFQVRRLAVGLAPEGGQTLLDITATVVLLVLFVLSLRRTKLLDRWIANTGRILGVSLSTRKVTGAILFMFAACYLAGGFFVVQPGHRGAVKRFGKIERGYVGPGLRYHWPAPFGRVDIISVKQLRTVEIGSRRDNAQAFTPVGTGDDDPQEAEAWMLAGDENIIDIQCVVYYQIVDSEKAFLEYLYGVKDKSTLVRDAAEWALRNSVATRSIDSLLTVDRGTLERTMRDDLLQPRLDACASGVRVVDVNLKSVHAPAPVHWAFRDVASAVEDQRQKENLAREYAERRALGAQGEATKIVATAEGEAAQRVQRASGDGSAFKAQSIVHKENPALTETRLYLEWIDKLFPGMNKYVDLMPQEGKGKEVWLRMGPKSQANPGERADSLLPWFWQQEETQ